VQVFLNITTACLPAYEQWGCNLKQRDSSRWRLETLLVHGGLHKDIDQSAGVPTVQPIYASTTYLHRDAEALDRAFDDILPSGEPAYVYARQRNPNAHALEDVLAQAEGGVGAVVVGSGMAAIHVALLATGLTPGAKILAAQDLYGVTTRLLRRVFMPLGIEVVFRDLYRPDIIDLIRIEQPDVVYVETLSNPLTKVIDLRAISAAAHEVGAISIVDSTFTTPYLIRPIEYGCDLVIHSATKYLGGHGDSTGGVVISATNVLLDQLRLYAATVGPMLSPFESHLIMRGLKTLALRMERHCRNALQVAQFLQQHQAIACVHYPGLSSHPQHDLASRMFCHGLYGGVLAFELKAQSREAAIQFMDRLQLCLPVTTLGDIYSEVSYPPMASHRSLTAAERESIGITAGCIRLSTGIEAVEDIIHDLDQALST
jgi:cystathionine beta-lyase/cystathionine gamma-synthase